jgi:hypothetical protein
LGDGGSEDGGSADKNEKAEKFHFLIAKGVKVFCECVRTIDCLNDWREDGSNRRMGEGTLYLGAAGVGRLNRIICGISTGQFHDTILDAEA